MGVGLFFFFLSRDMFGFACRGDRGHDIEYGGERGKIASRTQLSGMTQERGLLSVCSFHEIIFDK